MKRSATAVMMLTSLLGTSAAAAKAFCISATTESDITAHANGAVGCGGVDGGLVADSPVASTRRCIERRECACSCGCVGLRWRPGGLLQLATKEGGGERVTDGVCVVGEGQARAIASYDVHGREVQVVRGQMDDRGLCSEEAQRCSLNWCVA
eukprot:6182904-Pleurochrysis_carterae.AAC.1